jgi:hypothetical protein
LGQGGGPDASAAAEDETVVGELVAAALDAGAERGSFAAWAVDAAVVTVELGGADESVADETTVVDGVVASAPGCGLPGELQAASTAPPATSPAAATATRKGRVFIVS